VLALRQDAGIVSFMWRPGAVWTCRVGFVAGEPPLEGKRAGGVAAKGLTGVRLSARFSVTTT
jgi:hypothetical protein